MINTILLALTGLISALTPIMLAVINRRQANDTAVKANRLEEMHSELVDKVKDSVFIMKTPP